ncbi:unknown [Clostridium sp. CAG:1013]|nr:unknown [Clostridium sp. CAG:1013]
MTSRPLFIIVAESMVIFAPMSQLGWRSACSRVTVSSSWRVFPKKGPPDAVRSSFFKAPFSGQPCKH